jgi:hypothetical protein
MMDDKDHGAYTTIDKMLDKQEKISSFVLVHVEI